MKDLFKRVMFPLNIQLFSEDGGEGDKGGGTGDGDQGNDGKGDKTPLPADDKKFSQADVDAMIAKEKAKQKAKYEKLLKDDESNSNNGTPPPANDDSTPNPYVEKYAVAEIKANMATFGIDPTKIDRAVRLVDYAPLMTDAGELDKEKLTSELTELLKTFPELKAPSSSDGKGGFKIGGNRDNDGKGDKDIKTRYREAIEAKIAQDRKK